MEASSWACGVNPPCLSTMNAGYANGGTPRILDSVRQVVALHRVSETDTVQCEAVHSHACVRQPVP
jgi:hypothetical protein